MFKIELNPGGIEWHYCLPGQCADPGCPGDCVHIDTDIHHMHTDDHIKLLKACRMIAEVCQSCGVTTFEETEEP